MREQWKEEEQTFVVLKKVAHLWNRDRIEKRERRRAPRVACSISFFHSFPDEMRSGEGQSQDELTNKRQTEENNLRLVQERRGEKTRLP
jgi:hypothetical protein